jgi:hypothetical protein
MHEAVQYIIYPCWNSLWGMFMHMRMFLLWTLHDFSSSAPSAATKIQSCMRGLVGRKRLRAMRNNRQFSHFALESSDILKPRVIDELCALAAPPPSVIPVMQASARSCSVSSVGLDEPTTCVCAQ